MDTVTRTNYIFVDYESVQDLDLDRIANRPVKVMLILGVQHKKLPVPLVKLIQKYPEKVRLVETELDGKNALDFVLACEVGVESEKDTKGYFHVLSRDKGFDALIKHLGAKGVFAARHVAFSEIRVLMNLAERVKLLSAYCKADSTGRPKKQKALESLIQTVFGKALSPVELQETVKGLVADKIIVLSAKGEVTYK